MRRSRLIVGVGALAAVAALAAGAAGAPASVAAASKACGTFTGPAWTEAAFGKQGNQWSVLAAGVQCSFARAWSIKLAKTPFRGEAGTKLRGPAGWKCLPGIAESKGTKGRCRKSAHPAVLFGWGPDIK